MVPLVLHTTYLGPVSWYATMLGGGPIALCDSEDYRKQTVRNRCRIATANGVQTLTVPVTLPSSAQGGRCPIREVRISDHGNWRHLHWQALQTAYGMSPFFDYYADDLRPFYEKRWDYLFDFNLELTATMLRLLDIPCALEVVSSPVTVPCSALDGTGIRYYQTFQRRHGFIADLSIVDLLCNEGLEGVLRMMRRDVADACPAQR